MAEAPENSSSGGEGIDNEVENCKIVCSILPLEDNIAAYLEERELVRDAELVKCDKTTLEKVTCNYVIAKKIISNLSWQDKIVCKHVCSVWHSAVHALKKEQQNPSDFIIRFVTRQPVFTPLMKYKISEKFNTEPLVVLVFANASGYVTTYKCNRIFPHPCTPRCTMEHSLLDVIHRSASAPKECMLAVRCSCASFMPLQGFITSEHLVTQRRLFRSIPFMCGIYIPKPRPDVKFDVIDINTTDNMQSQFFDVVDKLAQTRIIKGVLVYVTENYLLQSVEDIVFLNYFKDVQPDIPYALGGCIVEDALHEKKDIQLIVDAANKRNNSYSGHLITIGLFTVPKVADDTQDQAHNFEMYSLILESSDWTKPKIQQTINEFSNKVPHFEHSVVLKLSCVGRDKRHDAEQQYFRAAFPTTRLIGCFGNGELGVNHPVRPPTEDTPSVKRHRSDPGPQFGIMYSYSTVFLYFGWGRVLVQPQSQ